MKRKDAKNETKKKKIDNKVLYLIECYLGFHLNCFLNLYKKYISINNKLNYI